MGVSKLTGPEHWVRDNVLPFLVGVGVLGGWLSCIAGFLNAGVGVAFRIAGKLRSFWKSLYPVNLGLSILAMFIGGGGVGF